MYTLDACLLCCYFISSSIFPPSSHYISRHRVSAAVVAEAAKRHFILLRTHKMLQSSPVGVHIRCMFIVMLFYFQLNLPTLPPLQQSPSSRWSNLLSLANSY